MKNIILCLISLSSFNAWSDCNVFIADDGFYHNSGHVIQFNFGPMFTKKGYSIVLDEAKADFILGATGEERYGKFLPEAHSVMGFRSHDGLKLITQTSIRCYTQSCAVSDFIKSFNKSYKKMSKALPSCK